MQYIHFSPLDRNLSRLVLGTMVMEPARLELTYDLLDTWLEAGGNTVDTAHIYNGGNSERALGMWLRDRGARDRLTILDKGAHNNADRARVTPEDIICDLRDSLARLKTDYIDLYLLHWDDPALPVGPIVEALNEQKRAGRIGAFGGSNWTPARIDEANAYAAARGLEGVTASSPNLSLAVPKEPVWGGCISACDAESRAWYEKTQMPLFAWSSQARGFFSGRYSPDQLDDLMTRVYDSPENWARSQRAGDLGRQKGGYTANQVAL